MACRTYIGCPAITAGSSLFSTTRISRLRNISGNRRLSHRPSRLHPVCTSANVKVKSAGEVSLPQPLRDATAILTSIAGSQVYVLGVSHVSKESCQQVEDLIRAVKPDVVMVELCKDRVPLLVGPDTPSPDIWYSPRVSISGLPSPPSPSWPSPQQLTALLGCRGGAPVAAADIEDDAETLLSTGLFASVMPVAMPPREDFSPAFIVDKGETRIVAPLGEIVFVVRERELPAVSALEVELQLMGAQAEGGRLAAQAQAIATAAVEQSAGGTSAVSCYLEARQKLLSLVEGATEAGQNAGQGQTTFDVVFSGVETGKATAVVKLAGAGSTPSVTGLEGSAQGGRGPGIQPLQRRSPPRRSVQSVRFGAGLQIDAAALRGEAEDGSPPSHGAGAQRKGAGQEDGVKWRPWGEGERAVSATPGAATAGGGGGAGEDEGGLSGAFASFLTQTYGGLQARAGEKVGVPRGAAWQTALRAAAAVGSKQFLLGDRPARITARRLTAAIWAKCAPFLLGSVPAAAGTFLAVSAVLEGRLGDVALDPATLPLPPAALAAAAAALPVAAAAWPVAGPLLEIYRLGGMSAGEIEQIVRVKEAVQTEGPMIKLWGEDALLDWPGALEPIIHERDAFMARSLAAAANGVPEGLTPALISTVEHDYSGSSAGPEGAGSTARRVLRYAMPEGGNPVVCPRGAGEGVYQGLPGGQTVVGVVGTAHLRGIIREWEQAQSDADLSRFV